MQPPPSLPADEPLYETFYGLREQPFALTTDPRFLYLSASHRVAFDELLTGLRRREGLLVLTGETGTGKTTILRAVLDALGHRTFSALILNPYMSDAEVLRVILRDFGLVGRDEIRRGALANADMPQLLDTLDGFLRSLLPLESYAVVVIDEAQSLTPRVLDQIRVLGGFEQNGQRLLQVILAGQPALLRTIRTEPMRALNERVSRRIALGPLAPSEVEAYIRHRLSIAGGRDAVGFQPDAARVIGELSHGLPRRVNMLCDRALEEGRVAGVTRIGADLVRRAAKALAGSEPPSAAGDAVIAEGRQEMPITLTPAPSSHRGRVFLILALMLMVLGGAGAALYARSIVRSDVETPALPRAPVLVPPLTSPTMPTADEIAAFGKTLAGSVTPSPGA